jgi:soluble lytic murein transglycosylase-like protein
MGRKLALTMAFFCLLAARIGEDHPARSNLAPTPLVSNAIGQDPPGKSLPSTTPFVPKPTLKNALGSRLSVHLHVALVKIAELEPAVRKYASLHGVDEDLVWAVMRHESGFNPRAISPKGAMGLMQLMPGTASLMGVDDPFNLEQNIEGGIKYLEQCLSRFNQDITLALAAYNAGPQNVVKYQGCPPFQETRQYVAAVLQTYSGQPQYRQLRLNNSGSDETSALTEKLGLQWQVPLPKWKVGEPKFHLQGPRWKMAHRLP